MSNFRGIFDFVDHPITNRYRDLLWEEFVRKQHSPYSVPRFTSRTHAYEAAQTIPQCNKISCIDQWIYFENIIFPFVESVVNGDDNDNNDNNNIDIDMNNNNYQYTLPIPTESPEISRMEMYDQRLFDSFENVRSSQRFQMNIPSMITTVKYIWEHLRSGILVVVRHGRVLLFCPFYNPQFQNDWPVGIPSGSEELSKTNELPVRQWWANGGILCTQFSPWGTHFCMQLKDYIAETVAKMNVQHAIFCVNKRDYPQYKYNRELQTFVEPYGFIYDRDDRDPFQDLPNSCDLEQNNMLPMFSFYGGERFLDILISPTEDLEISLGCVYLTDDTFHPHLSKQSIRDLTPVKTFIPTDLSGKKSVAFFRGAATGAGTTPLTNTRLRLFSLGKKIDSRVDALCVSLKNRIHKHYQENASVIDTNSINFPVSETFFVPMVEQFQNKYILYVEGHCAACRLGVILSSGCVPLIVKSTCVAPNLWYSHILQKGVHYISIENDFSDLSEKIDFLEKNPEIAQTIAKNARTFWETYIGSRDTLVLYLGFILNSLN
jgi:hypothetical protein